MSLDDVMQQVRRGVDRGVRQVKRTAEAVEAEARIFALHRKVGLRTYQLWKSGQLSHPDLQPDLEQLASLEARVDLPPQEPGEEVFAETRVGRGAEPTCRQCAERLPAGSHFCTHCGARQ